MRLTVITSARLAVKIHLYHLMVHPRRSNVSTMQAASRLGSGPEKDALAVHCSTRTNGHQVRGGRLQYYLRYDLTCVHARAGEPADPVPVRLDIGTAFRGSRRGAQECPAHRRLSRWDMPLDSRLDALSLMPWAVASVGV